MERYLNFGGGSSVIGFDIEPESITVYFSDNSVYLYSYRSAGSSNVEQMKILARSGRGLNSFIMRHVRTAYEKRIR